jgi:hypothetical protein
MPRSENKSMFLLSALKILSTYSVFAILIAGFSLKNLHSEESSILDCQDIKDCQEKIKILQNKMHKIVYGLAPQLTDFVRDGKEIRKMSHDQGVRHCNSLGSRMPTAREIAYYAQTHLGYKGIRASMYSNMPLYTPEVQLELENNKAEGYYKINHLNADGENVIDFYFNDESLKDHYIKEAQTWMWTSTKKTLTGYEDANGNRLFDYYLFGGLYKRGFSAEVAFPGGGWKAGVRCLANPNDISLDEK